MSHDYFRRVVGNVRQLFGGRIKEYEPLLARARRLALLRMTNHAIEMGFDHIVNVRIETARLDAECLLAHALGVDRLRLYLDFEKPVTAPERAAFRDLVRRRGGDRVPVAQLLGRREFWSLSLEVGPDVLVPRPETETLVTAALDLARSERGGTAEGRAASGTRAELEILDLGTGSGAIALALATELPDARLVATDASGAALDVARRNAEALGMTERIRFLEGDLFVMMLVASLETSRVPLVELRRLLAQEGERQGLQVSVHHEQLFRYINRV